MKFTRPFRAHAAGFALAGLMVAATVGCGGRIKTDPVESPRPAREFSVSTQRLLESGGLEELARQDPRRYCRSV